MSKLNNDSDVIRMCCMVPEIRLVIQYLDHLELVPDYEDLEDLFMYEDQIPNWGCSQAGSSGVIIEELPDSPRKPKSGVKIEEIPDSPKRHAEKVKPVTTPSRRYKLCANRKKAVPALPGVKINEAQDEVPTQASRAPTVDPSDKGKKKMQMEELVEEDDSEDDRWFQEEAENEVADDGWFQEDLEDEVASRGEENYVEASDDDDSNDDDYNPAKDDDEYAGYGVDDDFLFDWLTKSEVVSNPGEGPYVAGRGQQTNEESFDDVEDNEQMFGVEDSDEERLGPEYNSDDDGGEDRFPEFNPKVDMRDPHFCKGMKFATAKVLRAAIRERAIQNGWAAVFLQNDRLRIRAICKAPNCPFELFASKMQHEDTLMIKTYNGEHNCPRILDNSMVKTPYLTQKFAEQIKLNLGISTQSLAQTMAAGVMDSFFNKLIEPRRLH
ncbi:uncharacterized protein LOC133741015 [Rosa rugosa]|uniref:uncharacterized protein LOC133741015 n=1 Tax=Rosa rugosa TaxID=74645 RepID=UPI002B40EAEB|nr:uncharacterized protein LOC133741015 [Rosa rugosa]